MIARRVPPVHSPLPPVALWRGLVAGLGGAAADARTRTAVREGLQRRLGVGDVALVSSGTAALTEAIRLAAAGRNEPVVTLPAYGCYDLATACDGAGVSVRLYDLDPITLGPVNGKVGAADDVSAVIVVHEYGVAVDVAEVSRVASPHGALVIEDAAQGAGIEYAGRPLGSHGDLAILSFGRGKGLTGGSGGALVVQSRGPSRQPIPSEVVPSAGFWQWLKSLGQAILSHPRLYWIPARLPFLGLGETIYRTPQSTGPMSRAGVGLLSGTLSVLDHAAATRKAIGAMWLERLPDQWRRGVCHGAPGATIGLRLPILAPTAESRTALLKTESDRGVAGGYPLALAELPGFAERHHCRPAEFPGALMLARQLVTLPVHRYVTEQDMDSVVRRMRTLAA